jgi:hypothetical protein
MEKDSWKQAEVAIFISGKADFKPKLVRKVKEGDFILIKEIIYQENILIVYIYAPNVGSPNFIKQTLLSEKHRQAPIQ